MNPGGSGAGLRSTSSNVFTPRPAEPLSNGSAENEFLVFFPNLSCVLEIVQQFCVRVSAPRMPRVHPATSDSGEVGTPHDSVWPEGVDDLVEMGPQVPEGVLLE